jgi:hypothetical protein
MIAAGVGEPDHVVGSTTQIGCAAVSLTAARKFSALTLRPARSVRE